MSLDYCGDCKSYHFDGEACYPLWIVWSPEEGPEEDVAVEVRSIAAQTAAARWAEESDGEGDYAIMSGKPTVVHVRQKAGDDQRTYRFNVTGESVPEYTADEINPEVPF